MNAEETYAAGDDHFFGRNGKTQCYGVAQLCYLDVLKKDPKHVMSLFRLGVLYKNALEVDKDLAKAKMYFQSAAMGGHEESKKQLLYLENPMVTTADQWCALGVDYHEGKLGPTFSAMSKLFKGKPRDYFKARICYEKALDQNPEHAESLYRLGWLYEHAEGVSKNLIKAVGYYQDAVKEKHEKSKKRLSEFIIEAALWNNTYLLNLIKPEFFNEEFKETRSRAAITAANAAWYAKQGSYGSGLWLAGVGVGIFLPTIIAGANAYLAQFTYNRQKWTPLHFAAAANAVDAAKLLLEKGGGGDAKDAQGRTYIKIAEKLWGGEGDFVKRCSEFKAALDIMRSKVNDVTAELIQLQADLIKVTKERNGMASLLKRCLEVDEDTPNSSPKLSR